MKSTPLPPPAATAAVPTMPVHAPPVKAACRRHTNVHVPVCVSARETGGLPGNTIGETSTMSGPVGLGLPPGGTSHRSCALPAVAPNRQVTVSPALRVTMDGVHCVPLASTVFSADPAVSSAENFTVTGPG